MSTVEKLNTDLSTSPRAANSDSDGGNDFGMAANSGNPEDMEGLDDLEQEIVMQLEKEFGPSETPQEEPSAADAGAPEVETAKAASEVPVSDLSDIETSGRLLEIRRKRDMSAGMLDQIRDGASLFGSLAKQAGALSEYLDKTEADLKRLERIESSSTKLRIASEGLIRNNHEMKATIEEQRKKIALLESKIGSLRDANESARTNLARIIEEKRVVTVDMSALHSEVARLENDKRSIIERIERTEEENRELKTSLVQAKEREKTAALEIRKQDDDLSRKTSEIEELRDRKTQSAIEIEELKSRNTALETLTVEQKSRIEELAFEMKSNRKEMEEIIRLKQQRILELEARNLEHGTRRQEFDETMTPSMALSDEQPAKPVAKPAAKSQSRSSGRQETKSGGKSASKSTAKQPAKAN